MKFVADTLDDPFLINRIRATKYCAIMGMTLALAERIINVGNGQYVDADAVNESSLASFLKDVQRRRDLMCERNDLQRQIDHLRSEIDEMQSELEDTESRLGLRANKVQRK